VATNISLYEDVLSLVRKSSVGSFTPATFVKWINKSMKIVVDNKLAGMEINARYIDDLLPLHIQHKALTLITDYAVLPIDYLRKEAIHLDLSKTVSGVTSTVNDVKCVLLRENRRSSVLNSVYDSPSTRKSYYTLEKILLEAEGEELQQNVKIIRFFVPTGYAISAYISYYHNPTPISLVYDDGAFVEETLEWGDSMVNEIADKCSTLYIASINDPRTQISMALNQQTNNKL